MPIGHSVTVAARLRDFASLRETCFESTPNYRKKASGNPPSTFRIWPVIFAERPESRK